MAEDVADHRNEIAAGRRLRVRHDQVEHRPADELLLGVPEQVLAEVVHEENDALRIPTQHDGVGAVDDLAVRALGALEPRELTAKALDLEPGRVVASAGGHRTEFNRPAAGASRGYGSTYCVAQLGREAWSGAPVGGGRPARDAVAAHFTGPVASAGRVLRGRASSMVTSW